ncbi:MAG: hypothetical protein VYB09_09655 [Planctomycetota bacterium]|nr:hypothetical protein [Planctomycetota bacterium]
MSPQPTENTGRYTTAYHDAREAIEAISDPGDREIVQQTFNHIPSP